MATHSKIRVNSSVGIITYEYFHLKTEQVVHQLLRKGFEQRIGREIIQRTVGRANLFNADSATDILALATGRVPLIEPNYTITVPSNALLSATDFALRLAGSYIPVSPIPGSYWDPSINPPQQTTLQQSLL